MTTLDWYDIVRVGTASLALLAMWQMATLLRRRKRDGDFERLDINVAVPNFKDYVWIIYAVLFTQIVGALENLFTNTDFRAGSFLSFLIALVAVKATRDPKKKFPQL